MAFHSAQGPQLGLPQMIQSRPQFGYSGALLVWVFAYLQYAGFNVFNTILAGKAMHATVHGAVNLWVVIATVIAFVIALVGYDLIHRAERYLTYATLVIFGIFTVVVLTLHYPAGSFDLSGFKWTPFLGQFGVVAGYQISWAIYVSDYSRYLPPTVTVRKTFYWTYWGSALGGGWMMILGALLAGWAGANFDGSGIAEILSAGDKVFNGFGDIVLVLSALGSDLGHRAEHVRRIADPHQRDRLVQAGQAVDERPAGDDRHHRGALAHRGALRDRQLPVQLQQLPAADPLPVHPVDRGQPGRLLRRPQGPLRDRRDLQPGRYLRPLGLARHRGVPRRLRGDDPVLLGRHRSSPDPIAKHVLNGADISFFIGLPVAAILYWVFSRSIDVEAETRVAQAEAAELETAAAQHELP